jgi:hypothetical protein
MEHAVLSRLATEAVFVSEGIFLSVSFLNPCFSSTAANAFRAGCNMRNCWSMPSVRLATGKRFYENLWLQKTFRYKL